MIIWLSSYPRSGNTLVRLMVKRVFGSGTYSVYDDPADIGADAQTTEEVGHLFLGEPWPQAYERMKASDEIFYVKTHDIPIDSGKAIYIVRDGRSACRSYSHYLRDFSDFPNHVATVSDVIVGFTQFASWSDHLDAWDPQNRPDTLLLKFEELLADPMAHIPRVAEFLGQPPLQEWQNDFNDLNRQNPKFFRAGKANKPEEALDAAETEMFWALHGPWMRRLGYMPADFPSPPGAPLSLRKFLASRARMLLDSRDRVRQITDQAARQQAEVQQQIDRLRSANTTLEQSQQALQQTIEKLRSERQAAG